MRPTTAIAALAVTVALIAGLGAHLLDTQAQGRRTQREALERRATLTGKLIGSAFAASTSTADARARFGGPPAAVARSVSRYAAADRQSPVRVLDAEGNVVAATSAGRRSARRAGRQPHVRLAVRGKRALSDVFRDAGGRPLVEIAVPFDSRYGRRVLAVAAPVRVVRDFAHGFFASASAIQDSHGYLLDGTGRALATTVSRRPPPALAAALARRSSGVVGDRTFVSAHVPYSRWRVVLTVPSAGLYASLDAPRRGAWELFAAFTAALLGLLALAFAAARGARRLAAATERGEAARRLAHERLHDALTELPNRTLFHDRAEHALAAARRSGRCVAVLFMDIDHFKRINDSLGHDAGDSVLREVAERVTDAVRTTDTVSRFGGDEFVVLCEEIGDRDAMRLATRIQQGLETAVVMGERQVPVTVSIGVAVQGAGDASLTAGDLVRDADTAMYRAKDRGRGGIEVFDAELHRQAVARLDAEVALRRAIREDELVVHYQPIVALPAGEVHGVEALVRWRRPETGELVPPADFIGLAEETGLIVELGEWVLRAALHEVGGWRRRGLVDDDFELSVNVSARQLADPGLTGVVADALRSWDRPAGRLCLEITESAVMADPAAAQRMLESLDALGVRLAIDDFGVGHSSLGQLARVMPISVLKLDRSFVAGMGGARDDSIVEAAASLAHALGLSSVAEGVESAEQAARLAAMGFPYAQGFHFGRPADAEQIIGRLAAPATA